jgi:hypothetical protein
MPLYRSPSSPAASGLTDPAEVETATEALAHALEESAVARERRGGHAHEERELIRGGGLLSLTTPQTLGGWGHSWQLFSQGLRRLAPVLGRHALLGRYPEPTSCS